MTDLAVKAQMGGELMSPESQVQEGEGDVPMGTQRNVTSEFVHAQLPALSQERPGFFLASGRCGEANIKAVCGSLINSKANINPNGRKAEHEPGSCESCLGK